MSISSVQTAPNVELRIATESGNESTLGYVSNFTYTVYNGQREIFEVDNPFPVEIAQGATASMVRGSMTLFMLKGTSLERIGLVAPRNDDSGAAVMQRSLTLSFRFYDRATSALIVSLDKCKIGQYSVSVGSGQIITISASFSGCFATVA